MSRVVVGLCAAIISLNTISVASAEKREPVATFEGEVMAAKSYDISPEINNKIRRIHFLPGQLVRKGDLLVEFDVEEKRLDLAFAEAEYSRATAQLELAKDKLTRIKGLRAKNVSSLAKYIEAELNAKIAAANVQIAKVNVDRAKLVVKEQKLFAPFDGQMSAPRFRNNANVEVVMGSEIATLVQMDPIHVRFSLPYNFVAKQIREVETEAERFDRYRLRLRLPDGNVYEHSGKLVAAAFELDAKTGMLPAIAVFANPKQLLLPGLKVTLQAIEK
jgi:membrane fusion protein (multidrug efflux system)